MFFREFLHSDFAGGIYAVDWQPSEGVFATPIAIPDPNLICLNLQSFPKLVRQHIFIVTG